MIAEGRPTRRSSEQPLRGDSSAVALVILLFGILDEPIVRPAVTQLRNVPGMPWYIATIKGQDFPGDLMGKPGAVGFLATRVTRCVQSCGISGNFRGASRGSALSDEEARRSYEQQTSELH